MSTTSHRGGTRRPRTIVMFLAVAVTAALAWSPAGAQSQIDAALDHSIDLESAVQFVTSFRLANASEEPAAEAFGRDAIFALLGQPGCVGLRIYHGIAGNGQRVLVLVGVDVEGKDMYLGLLDEKGIPCPPICDESSPLNVK